MPYFKKILKRKKDEAIHAGLVRTVAASQNVSRALVSRTFRDAFKRPNPAVVKAIQEFLTEHGIDEGRAA